MQTQTPLQKLHELIRTTPFAVLLIVFGGFLVAFGGLLLTVTPRTVSLAYEQKTCVSDVTFAPSLVEQYATSPYEVTFDNRISVFNIPLLSLQTCFTPVLQPKSGSHTVQLVTRSIGSVVASYTVEVSELPVAQTSALEGTTVGTAQPIEFPLSKIDELHRYSLYVGDARSICASDDAAVTCDLAELDLVQGKEYDARLQRQFAADVPEQIAQGTLITLQPTRVIETSFEQNETIYTKPQQIEFTFDKAVLRAELSLRDEDDRVISTDVTFDDQAATVTWSEELPRLADYTVTVDAVVAEDGSSLLEPYVLQFTTSGGPRVQAVSVGKTSIAASGTITITLDQAVKNSTEALQKVSVSGVNGRISINGRTISMSYAADLCQSFTIRIAAGLTSTYDISNPDAWSYTTRTQCYSTSVIGTSQQGRAIVAYSFGSGAKTVLFTGALHGNEGNTKLLMDAWVNELELRAGDIPSGTRVVVVPLLNPDGYVLGTRANARNVDLNRNFDTSDWKEDIQNIYGKPYPGGGGSAPMSEKEAKAIATYTQQLAPRLTLSYHSVAGYTIGNTCGDSSALAAQYAQLTGYSNKTGVSGAFSYEITGTYDDWICERLGRASVLIELATSWSAEFERNRDAMWLMVRS